LIVFAWLIFFDLLFKTVAMFLIYVKHVQSPLRWKFNRAIATVISYAIDSHFACFLFPSTFRSGWMLTKALLIPFRFKQNLTYLKQAKQIF
jgi:hypothetical protein